MSADSLIARLAGVRRTGHGRWVATCPSHADKRPSLSVRELDDGTVLVNCFAGCGAAEVLDACGLGYDALFPAKSIDQVNRVRRPVFRDDVFDLIRFEASIVWSIGCDLHKGKTITEQDYQRLGQAISKLERIAEAAYGS